jgi:hypothetical protein
MLPASRWGPRNFTPKKEFLLPNGVPVRETLFSGGIPEIQIQRKLPLRVDQVQGNILAGFNRTIKTFIFLKPYLWDGAFQRGQ